MSLPRRRPLARALRNFELEDRGAAAAEFALWMVFMVVPVMNVVDMGLYIYDYMQLREAAQSAAQTYQTACGYTGSTPAATACTSVNASSTLVSDAVHSTRLGSSVVLASGTTAGTATSAPYEGWYCHDTTGKLTLTTNSGTGTPWMINGGTASPAAAPTCANGDLAGDYAVVNVTYSFAPAFGALSLITLFHSSSTLSQTSWTRLN